MIGGRAVEVGPVDVAGPYFEDLRVHEIFDGAPALTLTEGHAALHAAIVGDRLRLAIDATLSRTVLRGDRPVAHPALVCDVAIGQSTLVTQRVLANLFYRGLILRRLPVIGDTLRTTSQVVALRETTRRPDRPATGLAVLRIRTCDQEGRRVLDFWRCAMLPLRNADASTGHADDLNEIPSEIQSDPMFSLVGGWNLGAFRERVPGEHADRLVPGMRWRIAGGDVVSAAPELARLSLNIAMAHHDAGTARAKRLVYGGHTIGIAAAQATRALPNLVAILAWESCDHLAPVHEGDTLHSELELERLEPLPTTGALIHLRSRARAAQPGSDPVDVLDWRFIGVMA